MLMRFGPITFDVRPFNTHAYTASAATEFARKPVVGARQPLEHVGEGDEKLTIEGRLLPKHLGGMGTMAQLHALRVAATAQLLVRGDGKVFGWFVVETIEEASSHLDRDGVGQVIDFTVSLCRAERPSPAGFAFSLFGALQ